MNLSLDWMKTVCFYGTSVRFSPSPVAPSLPSSMTEVHFPTFVAFFTVCLLALVVLGTVPRVLHLLKECGATEVQLPQVWIADLLYSDLHFPDK